jgi:predicted DNA-binding transcriptional regulator YafY
MSIVENLLRYHITIKTLRKSPASFNEILAALEDDVANHSYDLSISNRTFNRDRKDILDLYDIQIDFDPKIKKYYIVDEFSSEAELRLLEAFDLFQALKLSQKLSNHTGISFENRKPKGTQYLTTLLKAISIQKTVYFCHQKFDSDKAIEREVQPLAIKESRGRWYLVAYLSLEKQIRTFGLDRVTELFISEQTFKPIKFDVNQYFEHCFGIIRPISGLPEEVILSFTHKQAQYIKTYPLHHSQKILFENETEVHFSVFVFITFDFVQEILSFGNAVKIVSPSELKNQIHS